LNDLSEKIIQSKPQEAIEILEKIYNSGNEPTQILTNLLGYFKNVLIVKNCQDSTLLAELTQLNEAQIKNLQTQSKDIDTHQIVFLIERISYYIKEVKTTNSQHLWLEISMIDLANLAQNTSLLELQARLTKLESGTVVHSATQNYTTHPTPIQKAAIKPQASPQPQPQMHVSEPQVEAPEKAAEPIAEQKIEPRIEQNTEQIVEVANKVETEEDFSPMPQTHAPKTDGGDLMATWLEILTLMNKKSPSACAMLRQHAKPAILTAEKVIITCEKEFSIKALNTETKKKVIVEVLDEFFSSKNISLTIRPHQPGDAQVYSQPIIEKKKPVIDEPTKKAEAEDDKEDQEELDNVIDEIKISKIIESKKPVEIIPSDQVTMVMNLFDGKYID